MKIFLHVSFDIFLLIFILSCFMFIFSTLKNAVLAADYRHTCFKILPLPMFLSAGIHKWHWTIACLKKTLKWYTHHLCEEQLEYFPEVRDIELLSNYSENMNSGYFITVKQIQNHSYYSNLRYLRITWIFAHVAFNSFKFRFYSLKILLVLRVMF